MDRRRKVRDSTFEPLDAEFLQRLRNATAAGTAGADGADGA
jgi:hypothetical protein